MESILYYFYSPYFAGMDHEDPSVREAFLNSVDVLPGTIRNFLDDEMTAEKIKEFCDRRGLITFEAEYLSYTLRQVICGTLFIGDASKFYSDLTGEESARAQTIINDALKEILNPIINEVKTFQLENFSKRLARIQTSPPPTPPRPTGPPTASNENNLLNLRDRQS